MKSSLSAPSGSLHVFKAAASPGTSVVLTGSTALLATPAVAGQRSFKLTVFPSELTAVLAQL